MRVLFDLNILIDLLMDRQPWAAQARPLVARVLNGTLYGYVCATSVTTAYYLARRATGAAQAIAAVEMMLRTFEVAPVGRSELEAALLLPGPDFEDCVQAAAALACGATTIVTRDETGFVGLTIRSLTAADLEAELASNAP